MTANAMSTLAASASAGLAARQVKVPSVLKCAWTITVVKLRLRISGFASTIAWIRRRVDGVPATVDVDLAGMKAAEWAVAMAGALYPGRALCLEQSLVLYYLLRRQGIAVSFRMGAQPHPFLAHAWVEHGGAPLNDIAEHVRRFARLPDQLP